MNPVTRTVPERSRAGMAAVVAMCLAASAFGQSSNCPCSAPRPTGQIQEPVAMNVPQPTVQIDSQLESPGWVRVAYDMNGRGQFNSYDDIYAEDLRVARMNSQLRRQAGIDYVTRHNQEHGLESGLQPETYLQPRDEFAAPTALAMAPESLALVPTAATLAPQGVAVTPTTITLSPQRVRTVAMGPERVRLIPQRIRVNQPVGLVTQTTAAASQDVTLIPTNAVVAPQVVASAPQVVTAGPTGVPLPEELAGDVIGVRQLNLAGFDEPHRIVSLQAMGDRRIVEVDLGSAARSGWVSLNEGETIRVTGEPGQLEGRPALFATHIRTVRQEGDLDRSPSNEDTYRGTILATFTAEMGDGTHRIARMRMNTGTIRLVDMGPEEGIQQVVNFIPGQEAFVRARAGMIYDTPGLVAIRYQVQGRVVDVPVSETETETVEREGGKCLACR